MRTHVNLMLGTAAAFSLAITATPALAQTTEQRHERGDAVVRSLNGGAPQPVLEHMRKDFPFLAEATEAYALGDVWSRPDLDARTRQLAAVAAFAALGELPFLKVHAGYALNIGVREEELKEIVYLTTVTGGFLKAIAASQALSELLVERRSARAGGRAK